MAGESTVHALLVEDDARLAELTREYLESHGVVVSVAGTGDRGLEEALRHSFDIVLLDVMLPGRSGIEVCQTLRQHSDVPVIMLTARGEEADRVLGLEIGADDYVTKPFSPRELLARVRALLRRARGHAGPRTKVVKVGDLTLDPGRRTAILDGAELELTSYEFSLLFALVERAGVALGRERLMELAKGSMDDAYDRSIDVHISRLRHKLGENPRKPRRIKTVRGVGYMYVEEQT